MNVRDEKADLRTRISEFFTRFRTPLIVIMAVIIVGLAAFFIGSEVRESRMQSSLELVEEVQAEYEEWTNLDAESDAATEGAEELLSAIDEVLDRYPRSYAAQRALFIRGSVRFELGEFEDAASSFEALADRFTESHLAPIALSNAAAALEEADDVDGAAERWQRVVESYGVDAAESARALFSLGRLAEGDGSYDEAAIRYNRLLDDFPASSWTNLARNRIIYLTTEGLIGS